MSDTMQPVDSIDSTSPPKRKRKASSGSRRVDLEKHGRSIEPLDSLPAARKEPQIINVGRPERMLSIAGGAALIAYGISRRGWAGLALAASGAYMGLRGVLGHCPAYDVLNVNTAAGDSRESNGIHVEQAITIDKSAEELYSFWREVENQALISDYVISVRQTGEKTSRWVVKGPANKQLEWDAEIINERPNELIAWRTMPGASVEHAGSVRFTPAPGGRGTEVHVTMQYYPPVGTLGAGIAMLLHREPSIQAADTLKRLKRLMETGDIVKVEGQSHGQSLPRTVLHPKS